MSSILDALRKAERGKDENADDGDVADDVERSSPSPQPAPPSEAPQAASQQPAPPNDAPQAGSQQPSQPSPPPPSAPAGEDLPGGGDFDGPPSDGPPPDDPPSSARRQPGPVAIAAVVTLGLGLGYVMSRLFMPGASDDATIELAKVPAPPSAPAFVGDDDAAKPARKAKLKPERVTPPVLAEGKRSRREGKRAKTPDAPAAASEPAAAPDAGPTGTAPGAAAAGDPAPPTAAPATPPTAASTAPSAAVPATPPTAAPIAPPEAAPAAPAARAAEAAAAASSASEANAVRGTPAEPAALPPAPNARATAPDSGAPAAPAVAPNAAPAPSKPAPPADALADDAPAGDAPDGDAPDGDAPDGDAPDGDAPDGDAAATAAADSRDRSFAADDADASKPAGDAATEIASIPPTGAPEVILLFIKWSSEPGARVASMRGPGGKLLIVKEGDIVEGMKVASIERASIVFQWRGNTFRLLAGRSTG